MIIMSTMHAVSITLGNMVFVVQTFFKLFIATFMFTIIILLNNLRDYLITFGLSRKNCPPKNFYPRIKFSAVLLKNLSYPENYCPPGQTMSGSVFLSIFSAAGCIRICKCFSYCLTCFIICFIINLGWFLIVFWQFGGWLLGRWGSSQSQWLLSSLTIMFIS